MTTMMRAATAILMAVTSVACAGCGDEGLPVEGDASDGAGLGDGGTIFVGDAAGPDASGAAGVADADGPSEDATEADGAAAGGDASMPSVGDTTDAAGGGSDAEGATDSGGEPALDAVGDDDGSGGATEDVVGPPISKPGPPQAIASSPADGQAGVPVPFTVSVTFDEGLAANTVVDQTVQLRDSQGEAVPVAISLEGGGATVLLEPLITEWDYASPYTVWFKGGIVSDLGGDKLVENVEITFYTEAWPALDAYEDLAEKYAPDLKLETTQIPAQSIIPTVFDADGDWDGSNTWTWIQDQADALVPTVHWVVAETRTHYFVHYDFLWPWAAHPAGAGYTHANGSAGTLVVVEKATGSAAERPVAVVTYSKVQGAEDHRTYVTAESGLVGPGGAAFYGIRAQYPQATLFPDGRYQAWLSAEHESCVWLDESFSALDPGCQLSASDKAAFMGLELAWAPGPAPAIKKAGAGWPHTNAQVDGQPAKLQYMLAPLVDSLWVRRLEVGNSKVFKGTFDYATTADRPGWGMTLPKAFVDPIGPTDNALGRPLWAWDHDPTSGDLSSIEQGWMGVDPAWYVWKRHKGVSLDSALKPWDEATQTGFSVDYCFAPFVGIDERGEHPLCPAP